MDTVMEYVQCINFHWILIVTTGFYIYLRDICLIGLCFEETNNPEFDPSYASLIFLFSALAILAEYRLWPRSLKEPPIQLLVIYEILFTALYTDLVMRMIWLPLMHLTWCITQESSKMLLLINNELELGKYSFLVTAASFMKTEMAATYTAYSTSILAFLWMIDATETLDSLMMDLCVSC